MDEPGTAPDRAIAETRGSFATALARGDAKAASAVYAEEARLLAPSAELLQGRDAIEAFWRAGLEAGISGVELEVLEVTGREELAYEIGRYALRLEPVGGEAVVDRGNYLLVHERGQDGSWRRAAEMFSPNSLAAAKDASQGAASGRRSR